jgi:hypothetical protein
MANGFVTIHGKEYETVASRVSRFRADYKEYTLMTKIVKIDADECIVESAILNETGRLIANGHAQEFRNASQINKTSYVENCETSAIGRALAAFGIGGTEYATANEVANAIHQQNSKPVGRAMSALKPVEAPQAVTPTAGAFDNMNEEEQKFIRDFAIDIIADMEDQKVESAYNKLQTLDNDEKTAIWTLLDSKIRSAIKRYADSLKG